MVRIFGKDPAAAREAKRPVSIAWAKLRLARPAIGGGERRVMRAASGQKRPLPSNLGSMQGRAARSADADSVLNLYHGVI
jgi:hypothetical protein